MIISGWAAENQQASQSLQHICIPYHSALVHSVSLSVILAVEHGALLLLGNCSSPELHTQPFSCFYLREVFLSCLVFPCLGCPHCSVQAGLQHGLFLPQLPRRRAGIKVWWPCLSLCFFSFFFFWDLFFSIPFTPAIHGNNKKFIIMNLRSTQKYSQEFK